MLKTRFGIIDQSYSNTLFYVSVSSIATNHCCSAACFYNCLLIFTEMLICPCAFQLLRPVPPPAGPPGARLAEEVQCSPPVSGLVCLGMSWSRPQFRRTVVLDLGFSADVRVCFSSIVSVSARCLRASKISDENPHGTLLGVPVCVDLLLPLLFPPAFRSLSLACKSLTVVCLSVVSWSSPCLDLLNFFSIYIHLIRFGVSSSIISSRVLSALFRVSPPFRTPTTRALFVPSRPAVLQALFIFLSVFSFCSSNLVISIVLFSGLLVLLPRQICCESSGKFSLQSLYFSALGFLLVSVEVSSLCRCLRFVRTLFRWFSPRLHFLEHI